MSILSAIKGAFSATSRTVVKFVGKVSPFVLIQMRPILVSAEQNLWITAYPIAVQLVKQLEAGNLSGLDKHSTAVTQLEAALVATGKIVVTGVVRLHLGQIVLAAYANSPAILAVLAPVIAAAV